MKTGISDLLAQVHQVLENDVKWRNSLDAAISGICSVHLAIFIEPYLKYVLEGSKTVESRFSIPRCPPWNRVQKGDILLLKASGGPVVGICQISMVWYYHLNPQTWAHLRKDFTDSLRAQDPKFWASRSRASYATLMRVEHVRSLPRFTFPKADRRGWVVLSERLTLSFE